MFGKRKQQKPETLRQQAVAAKIAGKITRYQRRLAHKLARWTGKYSRRQQIIAFAAFCLFFGLYCLYILYTAIY